MNIVKTGTKIVTNKYFLYLMVFLSVANILGYLVTNKLNAVIFFALISLLAYQFNKNMSIILLIALISTNFLMSNHLMREGMDNPTTTTEETTNADAETEAEDIEPTGDSTINAAAKILKKSKTVTEAKQTLAATSTGNGSTEIEGAGKEKTGFQNANRQQIGAPISNTDSLKGGPRIDYASTMETAYDNLDKVLGGDGIKQLTNDTQKLMSQQQQLFDTMNQMGPMLESAQGLLKGFDFKSLGNLSSLASSLGSAPTVNIPK